MGKLATHFSSLSFSFLCFFVTPWSESWKKWQLWLKLYVVLCVVFLLSNLLIIFFIRLTVAASIFSFALVENLFLLVSFLSDSSALEFQQFLPWQVKCQGNYMKMHFVLAFSQQFLLRLPSFDIKSLSIYLSNLSKNFNKK